MNGFKYSLVIMLIMLTMLTGISSAYAITNYDCNATNSSLYFSFTNDLTDYDLYFQNEKIQYMVTNELYLTGLNPNTEYVLNIENNDTNQIIVGNTLQEPIEDVDQEFYLQFGLIGLFLLTLLCLIIGSYYNYHLSLVAILLSFIGFGYCVNHEYGFMTCFIFIILLIISMISSKINNF